MTDADTEPPLSTTALPKAIGGLVLMALVIVYVVWGSTYLAIRVVVEQAPPMVGMGSRYAVAGILMIVILAALSGVRRLRVTRRELLGCTFLGLMLPVLGNGMVSVAEDHGLPSGITALLIAIVPLLIVGFRFAAGDRPKRTSLIGIVLGFAGLIYLVLAGNSGTGSVPLGPALIVIFASTCWGFGSWVQPRLTLPADPFVMTAYEMLTGGLMLLVIGTARGERLHPSSYDAHTWLGWAYLVVFGSMIAFTAYVWLLGKAPISLVATYAYINPMVAVLLGALILDEPITKAVLIGGGIIVVGVAVVISAERTQRRVEPVPAPETCN